jgi:hypothetical protein
VIAHLISGDSAAGSYRAGGGGGEVIVWREALIAGPLSDEPGWLETRAKVLASPERDADLTRQDLAAQELAIAAALDCDELVLWFARDLFCELGLLRVLTTIAGAPRKATLSLVCPDDSGSAAFQCFGELPPAQIVALADLRRPLVDADLTAAGAAWAALTADDPRELDRFLAVPVDGWVADIARDALAKQRARFPSAVSGLGRTEWVILELLAAGKATLADLVAGFAERLPGYGWTDMQIADEVAALGVGPEPLIAVLGGNVLAPATLYRARMAITPTGHEVLRAVTDRVDACGIDTWIGGVHLTRDSLWRFDESADRLLPT